MRTCRFCSQELPENSRFCIKCGRSVDAAPGSELRSEQPPWKEHAKEEINLQVLYVMVAVLGLAILVPPWETPPGQPPEFLGFHFILSPPPVGTTDGETAGVISRFLWTIELVTIAMAGFYVSWLWRKKDSGP